MNLTPLAIWLSIFLLIAAFAEEAHGQLDWGGRVLDQDEDPLIGAYIIHLASDHHAHSNAFGYFELHEVSHGDSVIVQHLGYENLSFAIDTTVRDLRLIMKPSYLILDEVVVGREERNTNLVSDIDLLANPVSSAQEIMQIVPGLMIGQHAGGGKAEQIFLRGFDIDHGTDIALTLDGIPVNKVSHAHGQGYADLHFIIPEALEEIDYGKGPYSASHGNFATAGHIDFKTKDRLKQSVFGVEFGQFNTSRTLALLDLISNEKHSAYLGTELLLSDGPFEASQRFHRVNLMAKYVGDVGGSNLLSVMFSHFDSRWDASGQIPQRAVDAGIISRFGAIDSTEGGFTGRTNASVEYVHNLQPGSYVKNTIFWSAYDFELYSNFTFFLDDAVNGDQIRQKETRNLYGWRSEFNHSFDVKRSRYELKTGVGFRYDDNNGVELSRSLNRTETRANLALGEIDETNLYAYSSLLADWGKWSVEPGIRVDYFRMGYEDALIPAYTYLDNKQFVISPKLNTTFNASPSVQLYASTGIGFHSNDTRVVVQQRAEETLPIAFGNDLGAVFKLLPRTVIDFAIWQLYLEQEFVYVGDEAVVEPSGRTQRYGFDFGLRTQLTDWLFFHGNVNYAHPRSIDEVEGSDYIPLAPIWTASGGLSLNYKGFTGGLRYRYMGDRPANEDNSIVAQGYFVNDFNLNYKFSRLTLGFSIQNLFNVEWNETQFATTSRLRFEEAPIEEIHFTPGTPFFFKAQATYQF